MSMPRLRLTPLEDRCTPASFVGNFITLDDGGEQLTISTDTSGQYTLTSTVDVNGETGPVVYTPNGTVNIIDSANSTSVLFANSTTVYADDFRVSLNDGSQGVRFDGKSEFGKQILLVATDRNIAVNPHAVVSSTSGNITFSANMQNNPRIGEFIGVDVQGQVTSTGTGAITVDGRGGLLDVFGMYGVQVLGAGAHISSSFIAIHVSGTGGGGSGDANIGVHVAGGAKISSPTGHITVTGTGGSGPGQGNYGVLVQNAGSGITSTSGYMTIRGTAGANGANSFGVGVYVNDGATISSGNIYITGVGGGTGTSAHNSGVLVVGAGSILTSSDVFVNVTGTGGGGSGGGSVGVSVAEGGIIRARTPTIAGTGGDGIGSYNVGVMVQGNNSAITSTDGYLANIQVAVDGTAGANGTSYNIGTMVYNGGKINAAGTGVLSVKGTGKGPNFGHNHGVLVLEEGANITGNGIVQVTGSAPSTGKLFGSEAVFVSNNGSITSNTNVTIDADALSIDPGTGSISAGTGTVTIQPRTTGLKTRLGGGVDNTSSQPTLNLVGAELARITASTLVIGNSGAGEIRVTNPVHGIRNIPNVQLWTGGDLVWDPNTIFNTNFAQLSLNAGGTIRPSKTIFGNPSLVAGTVTLASGSRVELPIDGLSTDQYAHIEVNGSLDLNNATLILSGNHVPQSGEVFTLVYSYTMTGTFANLPENSVVVYNGKSLRINYSIMPYTTMERIVTATVV